MSTIADTNLALPAKAVVSLAFPSKGDASRWQHLSHMTLPVLFVQGTMDALGKPAEINALARHLGEYATLKWIDGASHGFHVDGRQDHSVYDEIAGHVRDYIVAV